MSYRDIILLRKDARGWRLEDMGDEPPAGASPPLDPEMMEGLSEEDPQVRRDGDRHCGALEKKMANPGGTGVGVGRALVGGTTFQSVMGWGGGSNR